MRVATAAAFTILVSAFALSAPAMSAEGSAPGFTPPLYHAAAKASARIAQLPRSATVPQPVFAGEREVTVSAGSAVAEIVPVEVALAR